MTWKESCKFSPNNKFSKHCKKTNTGAYAAAKKNRKQTGATGKGYFGCSKKCRFYKAKI